MELLSPAGSLECGIAGIEYGADALYLGMPQFSARADATNLNLDELAVLMGMAHSATPARKVYVTVNTLLRQDELPEVIALLGALYDSGVDGLIIQDGAVAGLCRRYFPRFELHASTQLAIHNVEGARQAKSMGFSRVVLARELSVAEIGEVVKHGGVEVEVFIHGALCYSYSGLCLLSAALNGNSGNRGSCTYICRNKLKIQNDLGKNLGTCCPMSMKDLALPEMLASLGKAGVTSLKIEGRKKTPLYVAAVTHYYRRLLDGTFKGNEQGQAELDVKTIFSRPWTRFYYQNALASGITDTKHLGPRGIDVGAVNRVRKTEDGIHRLRFVVQNRPIEKHDGLQVELQDTEKPFGFPVTELLGFTQAGQDKWTPLFEAPVGTTVEVPLPTEHPELTAGSRIYCTSSQAVKRKYQWPEARPALCRRRLPVDVELTLSKEGVHVLCCIEDVFGGQCVVFPVSEAQTTEKKLSVELMKRMELASALKPEKVAASARQAFEKLGDTEYSLGKFSVENPQQLFLPMSVLNEARRETMELLTEKRLALRQTYVQTVTTAVAPCARKSSSRVRLSLKIDRPFYLNMLDDAELSRLDELLLDVSRTEPAALEEALKELLKKIPREKIRIGVPVLSRPQVTVYQWRTLIDQLLAAGWTRFEVGNMGALNLFSTSAKVDLTADWPLYAMNTVASQTWQELGVQRLTVCPEDTLENVETLLASLGEQLMVPVYQNTVLARSAVCIMKSIQGFCPGKQNCQFHGALTMIRHDGVQLRAVNDHCTTLLLETPAREQFGEMKHLYACGARWFRMDCTHVDEAPVKIKQLWERMLASLPWEDGK